MPDTGGDRYDWYHRPGTFAGVIPTNGNEACVTVGVPSARFRAEVATDVPAAFARLLDELHPT